MCRWIQPSPAERVDFMVRDFSPAVMLTQGSICQALFGQNQVRLPGHELEGAVPWAEGGEPQG